LPSRLHPIVSISCGPTAVCAVTGATSALACEKMMEAVDFDTERPSHLNNSAFRHQVRAIEMFGFEIRNADGSSFDASAAPMNPAVDLATYNAVPTVVDFVNSNELNDVVICYAARLGTGESHTFAADGWSFFDNNTGGVVVDASGIHPQIRDMKVIKVLRVRPRPPEAASGSTGT
jgi:hypothetical protein